MTRLVWIKRKSVAAVVMCAVLAAASIAYWQMNQSAEAAMVYPHPGLVGWWRFDEGSGTAASDSSGYGNDGTLLPTGSEPQWVDGKYGKALSFDGVDDYVEVLTSSSLKPNIITIEAWVYPNTAHEGIVVSKGSNGYAALSYQLYYSPNKSFKFTIQTSAGAKTVSSSTHEPSRWYHVAGVYNGTNLLMYVNGVSENPTTHSGNINYTYDLNVRAGWNYDSIYKPYFNGTIDEVRIYNRALSATEIQADSQKSPDFSPRLLAKVPKGTTQVIFTLSWQGTGSTNITIQSPSQNYTEDSVPVYQKTAYSTSDGTLGMLNVKRLSVSVNALSSGEDWYIVLESNDVDDYKIAIEVQK